MTAKRQQVSASLQGLRRALDPRAKRVQDLRELKEIATEKFDVFNQNPLTKYDAYLKNLRAESIRQVMAQTNDDARSMEIQTEEIETTEKSMQFPDDIGVGTSTSTSIDGGSIRFAKFLQRSAQVRHKIQHRSPGNHR